MRYIVFSGGKMERYIIAGKKRLEGKVKISGAKNSVLPLIAASVMNNGVKHIHN